MAAVTGVYVMKDSSVEVDSTEYKNQFLRSRLVPDVPMQQQRTLDPDGTISDVDSASWTWEISIVQKNDTGGFAKALRDATPGTEMDVVFLPKDGLSQPQVSFTVLAMPVPIGGEQGSWNNLEVVLPVVGTPVFGTSPSS